jgi:hypothetical protein
MKFLTVFALLAIVAVASAEQTCTIMDDPDVTTFSGYGYAPNRPVPGSEYVSMFDTTGDGDVQVQLNHSQASSPLTITSMRIVQGRSVSEITIEPSCSITFNAGALKWDKDDSGYYATTLGDHTRVQVQTMCDATNAMMKVQVTASDAVVQNARTLAARGAVSMCLETAPSSARVAVTGGRDTRAMVEEKATGANFVEEKATGGNLCTISGDPHIVSFSGYTYSDYSNPAIGWRNLYTNGSTAVLVQTRRTPKYQDLVTVHAVKVTVGGNEVVLDGNQTNCVVSENFSRGFDQDLFTVSQPRNKFWTIQLPSGGPTVSIQGSCEAESYFALAIALQAADQSSVSGASGFCSAVDPATLTSGGRL